MPLKKWFPDLRAPKNRVTPDEMDYVYTYTVTYPSVSATQVGTCSGGTSTQARALVITNKVLDYPRSLLASVVGTNDMGGVFVVNGKDQFGNVIQETFTMATAAAGTPAGSAAGTKVFSEVTSGTFTVATGAVGSGSARLGVGTVAASNLWGLPVKIGSTADVKQISWINNGTFTVINGGTIGSYVGTAAHTFVGTAGVAVTDIYRVRVRSTYSAEENYTTA
jgi:hypothetical protein